MDGLESSSTYTALNKRLAIFFREIGKTVSRVEIECGFSKGSLAIMIRQDRAIGADRLVIILDKYPALNGDWLLSGRGTMFIADAPNSQLVASLQATIKSMERTEKMSELLVGELKSQLEECKKKLDQKPTHGPR